MSLHRAALPVATLRRRWLGQSLGRERDRAEERVLCLTRVEPAVLHDDGHVRPDDARVFRVTRHWLRVAQLVEALMQGSLGGHLQPVWPDGLAVLEIKGDLDRCILIGSVEDAGGLVARHCWFRPIARARDV